MKTPIKEKIQFLKDFQTYNNGFTSNHDILNKTINEFIDIKLKGSPKVLTKTQKHRLINKELYEYFGEVYPNSDIHYEEGGRVMLYPNKNEYKNIIEYHQSRHDFWYIAGCDQKTKETTKELEDRVRILRKKYEV